jgi:leader peptidase (prepilin peptidase)/N-methyltransferase
MSGLAVASSERWGTQWRRPLVSYAMVAGGAAAFARFGVGPRGLVMAFVVAILVLLSVIDVERRILPNVIVLPAAALVLAAQLAFFPGHALEWLVAAFGASVGLFAFFLVNPGGMGMGDVKLAFLLGAALGGKVLVALVVASIAMWPFAIYLFARYGAAARKHALPFGPFLAFGALFTAFIAGV